MSTKLRYTAIMFRTKTAAIYLTRSKIWFIPDLDKLNSVYEANWDGKDLTDAFTTAKKKLKTNSAHLLLGADISYTIALDDLENPTREDVLKAASEVIPEDLDDHNFDWQQIDKKIQAVASSPFILGSISFAAAKTKFKIISVLSASPLLARSLPNQNRPTLILWSGPEKLAVIAYQGLAYYCRSFTEFSKSNLDEIVQFAQKELKLDLNQIVHDLSIDPLPEPPKNFTVTAQPLKPFVSLDKLNQSGNDEDILTLSLDQNPVSSTPPVNIEPEVGAEKGTETENPPTPPSPEANSSPRRYLFPLLVVIILLTLVTAGGFYVASNSTKEVPVETQVPTETPTPTPTPTPPSKESLQIEVQNGSGIPGHAAEIQTLLNEAGYPNVDTGNASNYDSTSTVIQLRSSLPDSVFTDIQAVLTDYNVTKDPEPLADDANLDLIIIIGPKNEN